MLELQREAEERAGFVMRFAAQVARAKEDAAFDSLKGVLGEDDGVR